MKKSDIAAYLHENYGGSKAHSEAVTDGLIKLLTDTLVSGEGVALAGFGMFSVKKRAARMARNPKTGEPVKIGERQSVRFKMAKALRESLS